MNKISTVCCTFLLSLAPVVTLNLNAVATPISLSSSKPLLVAGNYNSYRANWERAIHYGVIARPSKVADPNISLQMFFAAARDRDSYNATRRLGQYLVIYSERYGFNAAIQEERRIDRILLSSTGKDIRDVFPLFNQIFPYYGTGNDYAADAQ